jgi:[ribosomal protein S5]-alanine N-acetyltransferase
MKFYIETERLILRDLLPTDAEGMFELDSDPEVHKYVGRKPVQVIEESRKVIDIIRAQYDTNGIGRWAVIEKATGAFIGWSGLKLMTTEINGYTNYLDLGYRFIKRYWGKGYATETALASIQFAWSELKATDVYGIADVDNTASRNVLEKCGLQFQNIFEYDGDTHAWYELKKPVKK